MAQTIPKNIGNNFIPQLMSPVTYPLTTLSIDAFETINPEYAKE